MELTDTYVKYLKGTKINSVDKDIKDLIKGYTITSKLGTGGIADVYRAKDEWEEEFEIKVPKFTSDQTVKKCKIE
ncbi:MAG: hypothetical protein R6V01_09245 [Thermoplasmatota archaeon]